MGWSREREGAEGWLRQVIHAGLAVLGGQGENSQVRWVGADGQTAAYAQGSDGGCHWLQIGTAIPDAAGEAGLIDLEADGDFAAGARLRIEVARGAGKAATFLRFMVGNETVFQVDGEGRVWAKGGFEASRG
ncbi:MAG: hypothetical protein MUC34_15625 [Anaerolineae bacterium]|jgi:hypothetical protein|nr:hypothetical protein [Anaerolineae bacterium]